MGTFATAISTVVSTVVLLMLVVGLQITRAFRDRREMTLAVYGTFVGMLTSFAWISRLAVNLDNAVYIVVVPGVVLVGVLSLCLRYNKVAAIRSNVASSSGPGGYGKCLATDCLDLSHAVCVPLGRPSVETDAAPVLFLFI